MAMKLGELLVKHQVITEKQLSEALEAQKLFGGRLGTNLVELGFLSEPKLVHFLSVQLSIPAVNMAELDSIKDRVLKMVPKAIAEKYQVIPVSAKARRLNLAMADPTHVRAIDEVAFATGCTIQPLVAPEVVIVYALEKHYGIERSGRYVKLHQPTKSEFEVIQIAQSLSDSPRSASPNRDVQVSFENRGEFYQHAHGDFRQTPYDLKSATRDLAGASDSQQVFQILRDFAAHDFQKAAIFLIRGELVMGWHQVGCTLPEPQLRKVSFPVAESGLLRQAAKSRGALVEKVSTSKVDNWLVALVGLPERELFAVPIKVNDQPVAILIASKPTQGEAGDHKATYDALAAKISLAIQIASLRKRMLED